MIPSVIKRRLHRQIYFTIVVCLILVVVASGMFFSAVGRNRSGDDFFNSVAALATIVVPPANAPLQQQRDRIEEIGHATRIEIALYDSAGKLVAAFGRPEPTPDFDDYDTDDDEGKWQPNDEGRGWLLKLPDGRWLTANPRGFRKHPPLVGLLMYVALIAGVIGLGAWPFVRKLTSRLEKLQEGVRKIGEGHFSTRVNVAGKDEIATLATSFNTSAEHIERLVNSNRQLLAHASHELRTPLARVRLGVEMLREKEDPKRRAALERDIAELDSLIDEILTMSRLDTGTKPQMSEKIDLLALAAEECARYENCALDGNSSEVFGNNKLLRRLLRNLLDNAHRHGKPPVVVAVESSGTMATLTVSDSGEGISADQRDKVFEPFYRGADKQNIEGYGLGLALVSQIAKAHGGNAAVSDGEECRIIVSLPLA